MEIKQIYNKLYSILDEQERICKQAMVNLQAMGYEGFKRMNRYNSVKYLEWECKTANDLFDKYRLKIDVAHSDIVYDPQSLKEHLITMDDKLEKDIKTLGELNKSHIDTCGIENSIIKDVLELMVYNYQKIGRVYKWCESSNWNPVLTYNIDKNYHEKYKGLEKY